MLVCDPENYGIVTEVQRPADVSPLIDVDIQLDCPKDADESEHNLYWRQELHLRLLQLFLEMRVPVGSALLIEIKAAD
jgi:hypothetical protein